MSGLHRQFLGFTQALGLVFLGLVHSPVPAQPYPAKPIRLVLGSVPGGPLDASARRAATSLAQATGQSVIVENKPGGIGLIAAQEVAKAPPDGYTVLVGTLNDVLREFTPHAQLAWSRGFAPVTRLHSSAYVIVAHPSVPADTLGKLVELAKSRPKSLTYASSGPGGGASLFGALFKKVAGIDMVEVPYKSLGASIPDVLAGRVLLAFETASSVAAHVKAGKLKALAVTQAGRLNALPEVVTVGEAGFPGLVTSLPSFVLAPASTPPAVVRQLQQHLAKVINAPEYKAQLLANGLEPGGESPEELAALLRAETDRWGNLIKSTGLKLE